MSDPVYLAETLDKIETYAQHAVVLGDNLFATFESAEHPLNILYVEKHIALLT